jgi:outer membrane protein assembly factor BamB
VRSPGTTRCCSALALIVLCAVAIGARVDRDAQVRPFPVPSKPRPKTKSDNKPLGLFPLHTLWTIDLNNDLRTAAPPVFEGRHAFFPIEGNRIVAYDLETGKQLWIVTIPATGQPAASQDLLFVIESRSIDAFHVADGSTAWELPFAGSLAAPLVWDNGWLVAATIDGRVIAIRATDGHEVWRHEIGSPAHAAPTLAADRVYVPTEDGRVVALRVETGAPVWEHRLGGAASEILAVGDRLYVGSKDNSFYCLKTKDGSEDWKWRTGADVIGLPVADEHNVYFVSLDNVLRALNRGSGNQQWKTALKVRPIAGPVKAADTLIVSALELTLPAFKLSDGTPAGEVAPRGQVAALGQAPPLGQVPQVAPVVQTGPLGDVVAAPRIITLPNVFGPVVVTVTRDILKGATASAHAREIDPPLNLTVSPLPNLISFTPVGTTPPIPKP